MEEDKKVNAGEQDTEKKGTGEPGTEGSDTEKTDAEKLAKKMEEATRKAGGRESLIRRFGTVDVELSRPFEWCGKTYKELHMDFEGLTGLDMEAIDDEIGVMGLRGLMPAYSRMYQRMLASRAAKVPSDVIEHLPLVDYNAIITAAQNFLFVTG